MQRALVFLLVACSSGGTADGGTPDGGSGGGGANEAAAECPSQGGAVDCSCLTSGQRDGGLLEGSLNAVTFSGTRWFAVGSNPGFDSALVLMATAPNAWRVESTPRFESGPQALTDVAALGETAVAVGVGGGSNSHRLIRGPTCWLHRRVGTNNLEVIAANGRFLTHAGVEPGAAVSTDGLSWSPVQAGALGRFVHDGARFMVLRPTTPPEFRYSADGLVWTSSDAGTTDWCGLYGVHRAGAQVIFFGGRGVASCQSAQGVISPGSVLESANPSSSQLPGRLFEMQLAGDDARLLALVEGVLRWTPLPYGTGPWTEVNLAGRGWSLRDIAWGAGTFVAVGTTGGRALIATSSDGLTNWQEVPLIH
jgi:hypothetical protein